ncbi:protein of unknown function [Actinokineospora alba]|uniref:DUF4267 domain-containing protein n=1 Tax=Actinokineospora alba TaxID=504798 RepID=A0A1H0TVY0_9PSEU|nr:DUF4267 domain-containing protein [Actinokineospora alba]TDP70747.1 uncharacterized protein DUF4267 [Actinokineospora alba]SDJ15155.1 protein of unknown function [Actinokineospora alba]SDP58119.1 protein of unknown function [Actinokineospora alba]
MTSTKLANGLAILLALAIIGIGLGYLIAPHSLASGFGLPAWPQDTGFLAVKGIRDIMSGLVVLALLAAGQRRALAIALAVVAVVPAGDMVIVLSHSGSPGTAFGVHGATAALVLATAFLIHNQYRGRTETVVAPATS